MMPPSAGGSKQAAGARSKEQLKLVIQISSYVFILAGSIGLSLGTYMQIHDSGRSGEFYNILLGQRWIMLLARIVAPAVCLPLGLVGFLGAALERRWLLVIFVGLLTLAVSSNATYITFVILKGFGTAADAPEKMENAITRHYGSLSDSTGTTFTADLDKYQKQNHCCGWDGSSTKWLAFLKSPWHALANNMTAPGAAHITVPESCCPAAEASEATSKSCTGTATDDIGSARKANTVLSRDCMMQLKDYQKRLSCFIITGLSLATTIEVCCLAATITLLVLQFRISKAQSSASKSGASYS